MNNKKCLYNLKDIIDRYRINKIIMKNGLNISLESFKNDSTVCLYKFRVAEQMKHKPQTATPDKHEKPFGHLKQILENSAK